tara:strand:- start:430 stop:1197 length:768 start_codon:yes stop_codon:yes gene_type:complete
MATLIAKDLYFSYTKRAKPVLNDISIEIKPGTITALVGPNGAGKSTLLKLLQGQNKPDQGEISINGNSLSRSRSLVAIMPQRSSMNWDFPITVEKLVALGLVTQSDSQNKFVSYFKSFTNRGKSRTNRCCDIEATMQRVGISDLSKRRLDSLSGGQQQRALLAKTLMSPAKIFLLDEPCSALDPPSREEFIKIIRQLADSGLSLLVSSHDWGDSLNNYDEVIVLDNEILASGTPELVQNKLDDISFVQEQSYHKY